MVQSVFLTRLSKSGRLLIPRLLCVCVILSDFVQSQARRCFSGVGPEGGVANVCGLTGRAQGLGALRPIGQVTRRGIRPSARRRISWAGHDVGSGRHDLARKPTGANEMVPPEPPEA